MKRKKTAIVKDILKIVKEEELTYQEFIQICKDVRDEAKLIPDRKPQIIKPVPTLESCRQFIHIIEKENSKDSLMMRILIYTGIREVELVNIEIKDIDLTPGEEKIFLHRKAGRDKWIVLPDKLAPIIRMYLSANQNNYYLFESSYHKPYTTRSIRGKIQKYREKAGLTDTIHAHNFRHMILTVLASQGWTDSQLQLVSGHDSRTSLDRYIYQNPELIREKLNSEINRISF